MGRELWKVILTREVQVFQRLWWKQWASLTRNSSRDLQERAGEPQECLPHRGAWHMAVRSSAWWEHSEQEENGGSNADVQLISSCEGVLITKY